MILIFLFFDHFWSFYILFWLVLGDGREGINMLGEAGGTGQEPLFPPGGNILFGWDQIGLAIFAKIHDN